MIAAAGSGRRLGAGGPKAFVELAGRPLLDHSLAAVGAADEIGSVVIAAPPGEERRCERMLAARAELDGIVVGGGETRAESVLAGVAVCSTDLVLVHDAARPLAGAALFDAVARRLAERPDADAVIAAEPLLDTVKRASEPHRSPPVPAEAAETIPREDLWAAQTPQGFRAGALADAQRRAREAGELEAATDEARLIELAGGTVLLEPSTGPNVKITLPADLRLAEALLAASGRV